MTNEIKYTAQPKATFNLETNYAVINFDTDLHDVSYQGSHPTIIVPNITNKEALKIIEKDLDVWNSYYVTKAVRLLKEAGYEPIVLLDSIIVSPHNEPVLVNVDEDKKGMDEECEENNFMEDEEDEDEE